MSNLGHPIALWRHENQVLQPYLPQTELNSMCGRYGGKTEFSSLQSGIECPDMSIIDKLLKHLFLRCKYILLAKLFKTITFEQSCN